MRRSVILGLTAACVGLGLLALREFEAPAPFVAEALPVPRTAAAVPPSREATATFSLPPLQRFAAVIERPLFSPDRRPPPDEDMSGDWSSFTLAGIVIAPGERAALVTHGRPPAIAHLTEGQSLEGWTVASILPDRVVFRNATAQHELKLIRDPSASAPETTASIPGPPLRRRQPQVVPPTR